jgi:hypothetical protein
MFPHSVCFNLSLIQRWVFKPHSCAAEIITWADARFPLEVWGDTETDSGNSLDKLPAAI